MVVSFAIGIGWTLLKNEKVWPFVVGAALATPWTRRTIWRGLVYAAPYVWGATKVVAADTAIIARAAATTRTAAVVGSGATVVAAAGLGYTAGAVAGTIIVSQAEKEGIVYEGATADVLDFYTGEGHYWDQGEAPTPGYFNIPGNASLIAKHYWNKWV